MATQTATIDLWARDQRFLRAAQQVLRRYRIEPRPESTAPRRFAVLGGEQPYEVRVWEDWQEPPACTCPDSARIGRARNAGYCKHIIGVLLQEDALRYQLLELLL